MPKLSDSQLVVLSNACQRPDGRVYPVTLKLKGNAIGNVLKSLLAKGMVEEIPGGADDTVWRRGNDGAALTLRTTDAGLAALGIEDGPSAADATTKTGKRASRAKTKKEPAPKKRGRIQRQTAPKVPRVTRADSKQAHLIEMLERAKGASIDEITKALEWQKHTVRGAIAGALKKKLGLEIVSEKVDGTRVYRIAG